MTTPTLTPAQQAEAFREEIRETLNRLQFQIQLVYQYLYYQL